MSLLSSHRRTSSGAQGYEMLGFDGQTSSTPPHSSRKANIPPRKPVRRSTTGSTVSEVSNQDGYGHLQGQAEHKLQGITEYPYDPKGGDPGLPRVAKWGISWRSPITAILLFLVGVSAAVGNHVYFNSLHGTRYSNAEWTSRYGLVLAFTVKVSLVACIDLTYFQVVWYILRSRRGGVSLSGIDAMFQVLRDLQSFLVIDLWGSAPLAAIIAVVTWMLPLVAVVAPGTLGVVVSSTSDLGKCLVPTIDLGQNASTAFNAANSTEGTGLVPEDLTKLEYTGIYLGPSTTARKIGRLSAYLGEPLQFRSPCARRPNCTYTIEFTAPAWRCNETDRRDPAAPWANTTGTNLVSVSWYGSGEFDAATSNKTGMYNYYGFSTIYSATTDNKTGDFWIGHSTKKANFAEALNKTGGPAYFDLFDVEQFRCASWNATYHATVEFRDSQRTKLNITKLEYLNNVTTGGVNFQGGYTAGPLINQATHVSTFRVITDLLTGYIGYHPQSGYVASDGLEIYSINSLIEPLRTADSATSPGGQEKFSVRPQLRRAVEELSRTYTLSLMSQPQLVIYKTAPPSSRDGKCSFTTVGTAWSYKPRDLVIAYATAIGAAFVSIILGIWVVMTNGVVMGSKFSNIVCTTRNHDLDELVKGNCLGADVLRPQRLEKIKLRFGEVVTAENEGHRHAAFGAVGSVTALEKGAMYS